MKILVDPVFLFGGRKGHEHHIGPGSRHVGHDLRLLLRGEIAVPPARDLQLGILLPENIPDLFNNFLFRPEQINFIALFGGGLYQLQKQVDAGDPLGQRDAQLFGGPEDGRAVRIDERAVVHDLPQFRV